MSSFSNFPNGISQGMQQVNTDYDPHIIKPPDRNKTHGNIARHLVIDSRDRNYNTYPNSNKYRVDVNEEWKDIISAELTLAQIPNTFYNITPANNVFYISDNINKFLSIQIPEGQYNNESLIDAFNGKYGDLFVDFPCKLNFVRNPINLKLRIQSNRANNQEFIYNIKHLIYDKCTPCKLNSVDKTIGFINDQYTSEMVDLSYIYVNSGTIIDTGIRSNQDYPIYKLTAVNNYTGVDVDFTKIFYPNDYFVLKNPVNGITYSCQIYEVKNDNTILFEELDNKNPTGISGFIFNNISILYSPFIFQVDNKPYVILKIKDFRLLSSVGAANEAYTIIPLITTDNTIVNNMTIPVHGVIKYFNPPLGKLLWMDVEFLNYDGTLFDFRGQENLLVFTINLLNQPGKYNNYVNSN